MSFTKSSCPSRLLRILTGIAALSSIVACSKDPTSDFATPEKATKFEILTANNWPTALQSRSVGERPSSPAEVFTLQGKNPSDTLFLHTRISDNAGIGNAPQTRATPVDETNFYDSFGLTIYAYAGAWNENNYPSKANVEVTKASRWTTSISWPGNGQNVRFFAYAPYNGPGITISDINTTGTPYITYKVPSDVNDQKDLLVAASSEMTGEATAEVPLTFNHALTAIQFITGEDVLAGTISKITLKGVYSTAQYMLGSNSWSKLDVATNFSQTLSVEVDGSTNQPVTASATSFMMLPQTLPNGAQVEVTYKDNLTNTTRTLRASIAGSEWPMGKVVTYRITTQSIDIVPTFTVTAPSSFNYQGGNGNFSVTSYATVTQKGASSITMPLKWTAEFVQDNGDGTYTAIERPNWLTSFTLEGNGGASETNYGVSVRAQTPQQTSVHTDALKAAAQLGSESYRYALDTKGGTTPRNTANCYVINAPGKYMLPLIYGNAIRNDGWNRNSYEYFSSSAEQNPHMLSPTFYNYLGKNITSPYIYDQINGDSQSIVTDCTLVWQDAQSLVTNVHISPDKEWLYFDVDVATIRQGNAVVAVRDAAQRIMWSWHIWVTDYKLGADLKPVTGGSSNHLVYNLMPIYLGWCDGYKTSYAARNVKVRFTQAESGKSQIITINQLAYSTPETRGNAPYFQWGRKDPLLPGDLTRGENRNKVWYTAAGTSSDVMIYKSLQNGRKTDDGIQEGIRAPQYFIENYYGSWMWNPWNVINTWENLDADGAMKSIYDPCPVGYQIPVLHPFKALKGAMWGDGKVSFTCNNGSNLDLPVIGYRDYAAGTLMNFTQSVSASYCWTCQPKNGNQYQTNADGTWKTTPALNILYGGLYDHWQNYACPVLPMQEYIWW